MDASASEKYQFKPPRAPLVNTKMSRQPKSQLRVQHDGDPEILLFEEIPVDNFVKKQRINVKGNYLRKVGLESKNLILRSLLGKGAYGEVYLAEDIRCQLRYAVKIFANSFHANYEQTILYYLTKCNYPQSRHFYPNSYGTQTVSQLVSGGCFSNGVVDRTITMELFPGHAPISRLSKIIVEKRNQATQVEINLPKIRNLARVFFETIRMMHANRHVHLDLSPSNVMLPISDYPHRLFPTELTVGMVKFIDFGSSLIFNTWGETYGLNKLDEVITTTVTVIGPPTLTLYGRSSRAKIKPGDVEKLAKVCDLWSLFYLLCHIYSNGDTYFPNSKVYRATCSVSCWNNSGRASKEYLEFQDEIFAGAENQEFSAPIVTFIDYLNDNFNCQHVSYLKSLFFTLLEFNASSFSTYQYEILINKILSV